MSRATDGLNNLQRRESLWFRQITKSKEEKKEEEVREERKNYFCFPFGCGQVHTCKI